jgi:hypothetical protein
MKFKLDENLGQYGDVRYSVKSWWWGRVRQIRP